MPPTRRMTAHKRCCIGGLPEKRQKTQIESVKLELWTGHRLARKLRGAVGAPAEWENSRAQGGFGESKLNLYLAPSADIY